MNGTVKYVRLTDPRLHHHLKVIGALRGKSIGQLVEEACTNYYGFEVSDEATEDTYSDDATPDEEYNSEAGRRTNTRRTAPEATKNPAH